MGSSSRPVPALEAQGGTLGAHGPGAELRDAPPLTHAGRQGLVPHSAVPTEARQDAAAVHAVAGVAAVQDRRVSEVASVSDPVAIAGDARVLAFH